MARCHFENRWTNGGLSQSCLFELTNDSKNAHSPEGQKKSVGDQTDNSASFNNTPMKPIIVDDMELNEDQLDIISGGGEGALIKPGG